ncbi:MAG: protein translocase subunit SecD [Firmicutes bacterium]|nr:protein translocase subunit SecD [Bacillota bacterium]
MKNSRKSVAAVLIILITFAAWGVSLFGIGDKVGNIYDEMKFGLDINGGVYVLLEAETDEKGTDKAKVMEQTKTVLENRVNAMGVSEASVSIEGDNRIRVEMPGVEDAEEAIKQIGRTAMLKFLLADGTEVMTGDNVKDASIATDTDHGGYKITMDFTAEGADLFAAGTEKAATGNITPTVKDENGLLVESNAIVIMLDDEVVSAPTVNNKINSTSCEIYRGSGGFPQEEASQLSALIRGGALPATLTEVNSSVETATIGADSLAKSVKAGAIGLAIVMIIMIIVYGVLGIIADIALLLYVQMILWLMAGFGAVLTLPGIAGIILSIGMAVDSNVIIFTRIREEITKGKSIRVAVDTGFKSALRTVLDAQTTTLIAAIVLYLIGTSSVKGFALTLMIGTVCSIITAVFITQVFVNCVASSRKLSTMKNFGMHEDGTPKIAWKKHFSFVGKRKLFYGISVVILCTGLVFGVAKGFSYGIDFTGGTMMQIEMGEQVDIDEVKSTISEYDLDPTIVYAGDDKTQIVIRTIKDLKSDERTKVIDTIDEKYNLADDAVLASEEFGPTVGQDLRHNAVKSIIIAALCMLVYIRFRFKTWKYGMAAVSGLIHDVLITLALYAIFGFTINNPFIAGILTVVGYSINDTIVVFDRIRENTKFYKRKQNIELVDDSVNQTLTRSIMTSVTTLAVMIPLFILVSSEIRQFLIPLMIGVLVGTYSSIFLCSPLFYDLTRKESLSRYEENKEKSDRARKKQKKANDGIVK